MANSQEETSKASNASKGDLKAAEEGDAIVREEAAAELDSDSARHTEPKVDSDLGKETVVEASAEKPAHAEAGQNKREVDQLGEESGSAQDATELEKKKSDKKQTDLESDKVVEANGEKPDHAAEQNTEVGESGEEKIEPGAKTEHGAKAVPEIATATKTSKTIYLSCSNVISLKTFCEVKLQVCVSA